MYASIPELALNFASARRGALNRVKSKGFIAVVMSRKREREREKGRRREKEREASRANDRFYNVQCAAVATLSTGKLQPTRRDRSLPPDVDNLVVSPVAATELLYLAGCLASRENDGDVRV